MVACLRVALNSASGIEAKEARGRCASTSIFQWLETVEILNSARQVRKSMLTGALHGRKLRPCAGTGMSRSFLGPGRASENPRDRKSTVHSQRMPSHKTRLRFVQQKDCSTGDLLR